MFQTFWQMLRQRNLLIQALERSEQAFDRSERMIRVALDRLQNGTKPDIDIYVEDRAVNQAEVDVRRMVFEHLAINPGGDLTPALILLSVVIDIERIGDYAKNIYEQADLYGKPFGREGHFATFRAIASDAVELFAKTGRAVREGRADVGAQVMSNHAELGRRCEALIAEIANDESIRTRDAVTLALNARFLKRVTAHLSNLASSVVNPFDRIGFRPHTAPPVDAD